MSDITKIYVLLPYQAEWEDHEIFIDKSDAISCLQKRNPKAWRIEIFEKNEHGKFVPNYTEIWHTESGRNPTLIEEGFFYDPVRKEVEDLFMLE